MYSHGIPPVSVAGILGHSISDLMHTCAYCIPLMQGQAVQLMDDILTLVPVQLDVYPQKIILHNYIIGLF